MISQHKYSPFCGGGVGCGGGYTHTIRNGLVLKQTKAFNSRVWHILYVEIAVLCCGFVLNLKSKNLQFQGQTVYRVNMQHIDAMQEGIFVTTHHEWLSAYIYIYI